jgi:sulfopyruvate decarboxylase TPP-binding subunit
MSRATEPVLSAIGVTTMRVDRSEEVADAASAAAALAFDSDQPVAVLLSQRLIGRKQWTTK